MKIEAVLDASALLALLQGEPGGGRVRRLIGRVGMSAVNLAEVTGKLRHAGIAAAVVDEMLDLAIEILPFDARTARSAGELVPSTSPRGLSLGDRCCLATGLVHELPAITSDRSWSELDLAGIEVEVIR